jgi:hypothetical protein
LLPTQHLRDGVRVARDELARTIGHGRCGRRGVARRARPSGEIARQGERFEAAAALEQNAIRIDGLQRRPAGQGRADRVQPRVRRRLTDDRVTRRRIGACEDTGEHERQRGRGRGIGVGAAHRSCRRRLGERAEQMRRSDRCEIDRCGARHCGRSDIRCAGGAVTQRAICKPVRNNSAAVSTVRVRVDRVAGLRS